MVTNSRLKIKFSGTTPKEWGNKCATQPITLELQLETSTPLDMMNKMILDGFKVKRNDRAHYHPALMAWFPPKLLDITGKHVVGDLSLRSNENVIVHMCRQETPLRPKREAAEVTKSSFQDAIKAPDAMIKRNMIKQKKVSSSKIQIRGPGYHLSDCKDAFNTLNPIIYLQKRSRQKDSVIDYLTIQLFTSQERKINYNQKDVLSF